jgi:hypothetical protein
MGMTTTKKIMLGVGVAGGALLAAWLLTGDRKTKTKEFVAKKAEVLKRSLKKQPKVYDDSEVHYV